MVEREKLICMVQGVQRGAEDAFTELYDTFHNDIYYHILKTIKEPELAADLTQDTFVEILQTIHKLEEPAAFVTWAKQIAYHRCTAYARKRHELLADEDEDGYSVFDTIEEERGEFIPGEALDQQELKTAIGQMIDALPMEQRSALMMRYYDEISVKEIAQIQGVSEGTVKSRLNYARKAVKDSVEQYEKKNGVKLRCVGVVPLLLWLLRQQRRTSGAAGVLKTASATGTASTAGATTVGTAATVTAASGGFTAKIIAAVVAVAVTAGGITAAVLKKPEPEQERPKVWVGYGDFLYAHSNRRFEVTVDEMDDTRISGSLEVSYLYDSFFETEFTGTGTKTEDGICYSLTYETHLNLNGWGNSTYDSIDVYYDSQKDCFRFADYFRAELVRDGWEPEVLAQPGKWSGIGSDRCCWPGDAGHLFELEIDELTNAALKGRLRLFRDGNLEHETEIIGRCFVNGDLYHFEIKFETPRHEHNIVDVTIESLWLKYDRTNNTFHFNDPGAYYKVTMTRQ